MEDIQVSGPEIEAAFVRLWELIRVTEEPLDAEYFSGHKERYQHCVERICALCPRGARVLDIGSHFLHQAGLLKLLGFEVLGLDVSEFTGIDFVRRRAKHLQIENLSVASLDGGHFLEREKEGSIDCVLFTEILEHITFNPIGFWRQVYTLLRVGGIIYITTPNSLRLVNLVSTIKRAVTLSGVGLDIAAIFSNVTYGHHWKEYSAAEMVRYFSQLSPDFSISVNYLAYRRDDAQADRYLDAQRIKSAVRESVRRVGNRSRIFAEELEVVVRLEQRVAWLAQSPSYH